MISSRNIIFNAVNKVITNKSYQFLTELIDVLHKHQSCLSKLLVNDPKNQQNRNLILNSSRDPIQIDGIPQKVSLTNEYIQETFIISDMFKLNEMTAVELLMSGEAESTANPDMTRGLIAILNYYYSQKTIVESLKILMQARLLINEDSVSSGEVVTFIETFLDNLFQGGLFNHIVNLLKSMDIETEVAMLESQMALGPARHRRQFYLIFDQIRNTLADCIMLRAYKAPLNKKDTIELIGLIRHLYREDVSVKKEELTYDIKATKNIDNCFVYLLTSLINSINPIIDGNNVENYSKECFSHPFFSDNEYQKDIDKLLKDNLYESSNADSGDNDSKSVLQNLDQILYLAWIISLQKMSHLKKESVINVHYQRSTSFGDYDDFVDLEVLEIDCQQLYECFQFLIKIINICGFHDENIWVKCAHDLVTDFIIYMPKMVKDLRTESMRIQSNAQYFGSLLELIGRLYGGPDKLCESPEPLSNPLLETLVLEYWSPQEIVNYSDSSTLLAFEENFKNRRVKSNDSYKQAVLFKFIRDSGDMIDNAQLFISYVFMLKGLCCSDKISLYIYSLLNNNQISHQTSRLTWEWFSNSLHNHAKFLMSTPHNVHTMCSAELNGLLVVLQLIKRVTQHSKVVCNSMISNESLMLAQNIIMLLSCRVPEILKGELFNCLAVFCGVNGLVAKNLWHALESNNIMTRPIDPLGSSIFTELDQNEPKSQQYFITRAFIQLLLAEVGHIVSDVLIIEQSPLSSSSYEQAALGPNTPQYLSLDNFTNVLHMVLDSVFLKHTMRTYKNIEEKFVIAESFLRLCCKCVDIFLAQVGNATITKGKLSWCQYDPGFFIVSQLLNDSLFLKTIVNLIDSGYTQINDSLNNVTFGSRTLSKDAVDSLQNSIYFAMHLLWTVLNKESFLVQLVRELNSKTKNDISCYNLRMPRFKNFVPQELSRLLMSSTSNQHFLPNLMKYISIADETERISRKALSILYSCINLIEPHNNLMLMLTNKNIINIDILPLLVNCIDKFGDVDPIFVEFIEDKGVSAFFFNDQSKDSPRTLVLKLLISCLEKPSPNLGHHLLGFSCTSIASLKRTSLQEAGVGDSPKTCLHALLNLIHRLSSDIVNNPCYDNPETPGDQLAALVVNMMDLSLAFRILHILASDQNTSLFVLRFIRSNYQLIFNQMELLSFDTTKVAAIPELRALFWNQKSWLLKIIAIELRQCTANQQRSYVSRLLKLLFGDDLFEISNETVFAKLYNEEQGRDGLIYKLLEDMDISEPEECIDFSSCQRFKPQILKEYLNQCFEDSYQGLKLMNGDKLKQLIFADINLAIEEEQLLPLHLEIETVCRTISLYNAKEIWLMFGKNCVVDGLRQVLETVMVTDCSGEDTIHIATKTKKLCDTLRLIMEKILVASTPNVLVTSLSSTCLILTAVLGAMFVPSSNDTSTITGHLMPDDIIDLEANNKMASVVTNNDIESQLRLLMQLTVDCILKIGASYQNTRIKFYGVLTYLIQIVLKMDNNNETSSIANDCYVIINNSSSASVDSVPERCLYPILCRDAVSGNIHLSLSSLTLLDCVASIDKGHGSLLPYVINNGYLQHLITSLTKDCANIAANMKLLSTAASNYDQETDSSTLSIPYYLYQSKMSLFCTWATQSSGARVLVQYGALSCLSRCDLFRVRPSTHTDAHMMYDTTCDDESANDMDECVVQYRNVLALSVQLATSILSTQGLEKMETVREVLQFVGEFIEVLCEPFHSSSSALSSHVTKEMILISNLFVLASSAVLQTESALEYQYGALDKIKTASSQMLACLLALLNEPCHSTSGTMQHLLQIQLMNNLLATIAGIVSAGVSGGSSRLLFFSSNIDGVAVCRNNWGVTVKKICQKLMSGEKPPLSLMVMVLYKVHECVTDIREKLNRFLLSSDLNESLNVSVGGVEQELEKMSTDQLKVVWHSIFESDSGANNGDNGMSMDCYNSAAGGGGETRQVASVSSASKSDLIRELVMVYRRMSHVLTGLTTSLETCCYLLWHHLAAYKTAASSSLGSVTDASTSALHPIQRLQIQGQQQQQQTKIERIELSRHNAWQMTSPMTRTSGGTSATADIVSVVSQCIDDELLVKIQQSLEIHPCATNDRATFAKVIIHRLARMLTIV